MIYIFYGIRKFFMGLEYKTKLKTVKLIKVIVIFLNLIPQYIFD